MAEAALSPQAAAAAVRRNTLLLAGGMAALYGMVEMAAGTATLTFEDVGGSEHLSGFAPAAFLAGAAVVALPAGRAMDHYGRAPVLSAGFAAGIAGSLSAALGVFAESMVLVLLGFLLVGPCIGIVLLSRAAAADMYPPERRASGIGWVLFGAVFGALLGPAIFIPLVQSGGEHGSSLGPAWLGAAGFVLIGLLLMRGLRPDPQRIGRALGHDPGGELQPAAPLRRILARAGVGPALVGSAASWAAMVPIMTLTGSALVEHGHSKSAIFPVISAHFVGMFGLFPVIGGLVDRAGRSASLGGGLLILAASCAALSSAVHSVPMTAFVLLGVGVGWNLAFVAASTELAERTSPAERGKLLGFSDLISNLLTTTLTIAGGLALAAAGLAAVSFGAAVLPALAAIWILRTGLQPQIATRG